MASMTARILWAATLVGTLLSCGCSDGVGDTDDAGIDTTAGDAGAKDIDLDRTGPDGRDGADGSMADLDRDAARDTDVSVDIARDQSGDVLLDRGVDVSFDGHTDMAADLSVDVSSDGSDDVASDKTFDTSHDDTNNNSDGDSGSPTAEGGTDVHTPDGGIEHSCGNAGLGALPSSGTTTLLAVGVAGAEVHRDGDYVLGSGDGWIAWNAASGIATAAERGTRAMLGGGIVADFDSVPRRLRTFSAATGVPMATIQLPIEQFLPFFGIASDGSYVWSASQSGLRVWSSAGVLLASSLLGDYRTAAIYGGPAQLLVGRGPAGANVIETVYTDGRAPTTSAAFTGTFASWFGDGTKFVTTLGNNAFVYTAEAVQVQLFPFNTTIGEVGGSRRYFWHRSSSTLDVYEVGGNGQPAKSYVASAVKGGPRLLAFRETSGLRLIDLDTSPIVDRVVAVPLESVPVQAMHNFASDENGYWAAGSSWGFYSSGASSAPSQARVLGCGAPIAVTGSVAGFVVLATSGGGMMVINLTDSSVARIPLAGGLTYSWGGQDPAATNPGIKLSADGHTLTAVPAVLPWLPLDSTLYTYTWPTWQLARSFSHPSGSYIAFDMSDNASTIARKVGEPGQLPWNYSAMVSDMTGTPTIWSETGGGRFAPILSPSGRYWATIDARFTSTASTRLYDAGVFKSAVPGTAIGWLDDGRLVVQVWVPSGSSSVYGSTNIYDPQGTLLSSPPLPDIRSFDVVGPTTIFSKHDYNIYDVTTGALVSSTGVIGSQHVVVGPYIISLEGPLLKATRY